MIRFVTHSNSLSVVWHINCLIQLEGSDQVLREISQRERIDNVTRNEKKMYVGTFLFTFLILKGGNLNRLLSFNPQLEAAQ